LFPDNVNREQSLRKILACETTALLLELHNVVSATFMVARPLRVDLQRDRISLRTNGKAGYASCNETSFPRVRLHVIRLAAVIMTRVYRGDDFGDYYSDPPYWSYTSHGSGHTKSAHWLYKNHRYVFIDITLKYASR
jgi:hypothetical protein